MSIPTIFSDICSATGGIRGRQDSRGGSFTDTGTVTVPVATAGGTNIGFIFCPAGTKVRGFTASFDDVDTGTAITCDLGYMYIDTAGTDNVDAFIDGSALPQTGGVLNYPAAAASAGARVAQPDGSFIFEYDGFITGTLLDSGSGGTTTAGTIKLVADLEYGAVR